MTLRTRSSVATSQALPARRGVGLLEALIGLVILAYGMLAMTRLQARLVAQGTDAQARQVATQHAGELMSMVRVDLANVACYTKPVSTDCADTAVGARTNAWAAAATAALPAPATASASVDTATGMFTVRLTWLGKSSGEARLLETFTDVRL